MCTEELIGESDHLLRLAEEQRDARGGACFRRMQKDGPTDPVEEGQMRPSNVGETLPLVGTGQLKDIRS